MSAIADRYYLGRQRVGQIITQWRICAVNQGYVQVVDEAMPIPDSCFEDLHVKSSIYADSESDQSATPADAVSHTLFPGCRFIYASSGRSPHNIGRASAS